MRNRGPRRVSGVIPYERLEMRRLFAAAPVPNGAGVTVGQVEADLAANQFEVNPAAVGQPASLFTYTSPAGSVSGVAPPNIAGTESGHADSVGQIFYGVGTSVASGVKHVDNYEVNYFVNNIISTLTPITDKVVNQSFIATDDNGNPIEDPALDQLYDNYIATYNTIIVSSAGNGGEVASPSSSYNGISVGSSNATVSQGPTADGRSKPDISAPGGETSYTAPAVAAAAAVLVQAGQLGLGGFLSSFGASNAMTIKALLMNGADKPANWAHTPTAPLDPRYGAGALDLNNSLAELKAGEDFLAIPSFMPIGASPTPLPTIPFLSTTQSSGWNLGTIVSTSRFDAVNNYEFTVTGAPSSTSTLTATLVWERHANQANINNLDLYLYNTDTHKLIDQSISSVDNVQELFTQKLPPGRYDLEVVKPGGTPGVTPGDVSNAETYALAFNFARGSSAANPLALAAIASAANVSPPQVYPLPATQLQWQAAGDLGNGDPGV